MLALDIGTLYFSIGMTLVGITLGLALTLVASPRLLRGAHLLAACYFVAALGWLLFLFTGSISEALRIVLTNFFIVLGLALLYFALCHMLSLRANPWVAGIALAAILLSTLVYGVWRPDYSMRVGLASLILSFQASQISLTFFGRSLKRQLSSERFTGTGFVVFALFFAVRSMVAFSGHLPETSFMENSPHTLLLAAVTMFASILLPFAFLLISNEQHFSRLQQLADTDTLTGALSRHALMVNLGLLIESCRTAGQPLSVCMLDLDGFKAINDRYGHLVGDDALAVSAAKLRTLLRQSDLVGRYGGDEFLLVLPNTSMENAHLLAERLRQHFEKYTMRLNNQSIVLTLSQGLTTLKPEDTPESLVQRADEALYRAKSQRNQVVVA